MKPKEIKNIWIWIVVIIAITGAYYFGTISNTPTSTQETPAQPNEQLACAQLGGITLANTIASDGTTKLPEVSIGGSTFDSHYNPMLGKCYILVSYTVYPPNGITYVTVNKILWDAIKNIQIATYTADLNRADLKPIKLWCTIFPTLNFDCTESQFNEIVSSAMNDE